MITVAILFALISCSISVPLPLGPGIKDTIYPGQGSKVYEITSNVLFEVDLIRTSTTTSPYLTTQFTVVSSSSGYQFTSYGQVTIQGTTYDNKFIVTVQNPIAEYSYLIRYCEGYCPSSCSVWAGSYCAGNGACNLTSQNCICDDTGLTYTTDTCRSPNLWTDFFVVWIVLICVAAALIIIVPCIICCCCFGACAAGTVSAINSESTVKHVYVTQPAYGTYQPVPQYNNNGGY
eukprot:TRINITY_DN2348_c0_g1_i1.p1 TRINITY_DN2348_c0_g1~~TRINITY_DN2348_c0_g1_i1.p1  ORF type:complete len:233 (-),score=10.55 TRINITY_DN2348_c0_g1_i1:297-995(-)